MAVSAFRSTTKRSCQIGPNDASVPATPRSKRESSREPPSRMGSHRRSCSMTDFSPKYISDCSSTSDYRPYRNQSSGRRSGRNSVCPSDTESETESRFMYQRPCQKNVESEDESHLSPSLLATNFGCHHESFGRTSSLQDFSKHKSELRLPSLISHNGCGGDDFAEEKTIRAVNSKIKSLQMAPPVVDLCSSDFLDAMRSEVRLAVAEIRMELEQSIRKNCQSSKGLAEGIPLESQGTNGAQASVDIRSEYSTKLERSEKRVRALWSQLAVEEQRCVELTKIVKEILTLPPSSGSHSTSRSTSNRRRHHKRKNSAERQVVSANLDNEAQKYFEECVSISAVECQGDTDDSFFDIDQQSKSMKIESCEKTSKAGKKVSNPLEDVGTKNTANFPQGDKQQKIRSVASDGVTLPWLQWETEGGANDKNLKKMAKRYFSPKTSNSGSSLYNRVNNVNGNPFYTNGHAKLNLARKSLSSEGKISAVELSPETLSPEVAMGGKIDKFISENASDESGLVMQAPAKSFYIHDDNLVQMTECFPNVDSQLLERIQFKCRVDSGELLLCQGLFL